MACSILLTVKRPDGNNYLLVQEYESLLSTLAEIEKRKKGLRILSENCLLISLDKGLQDISDVVRALRHLSYVYTILTEDTKWHEEQNKD